MPDKDKLSVWLSYEEDPFQLCLICMDSTKCEIVREPNLSLLSIEGTSSQIKKALEFLRKMALISVTVSGSRRVDAISINDLQRQENSAYLSMRTINCTGISQIEIKTCSSDKSLRALFEAPKKLEKFFVDQNYSTTLLMAMEQHNFLYHSDNPSSRLLRDHPQIVRSNPPSLTTTLYGSTVAEVLQYRTMILNSMPVSLVFELQRGQVYPNILSLAEEFNVSIVVAPSTPNSLKVTVKGREDQTEDLFKVREKFVVPGISAPAQDDIGAAASTLSRFQQLCRSTRKVLTRRNTESDV